MADIYPTIDELTESTVMLNMRKLAGAVDKNNQAIQQNVQQAIDTANNAMEATQGFDDRISQNEQDITTLKGNVATIEEDITAIETKNTEQDTAIEQNATAIETEKNARTQNDITDVGFTYNPNTGSLGIQLLRSEGDLEDSVIARFIKTATLIPTSTSRAFKISFEFYDGTSYDTNEFLIPEGGGTDVSVTGVTVVDGTTPDSFQVQIQLSDGEPLKSNDYVIDIPASENTYPTAVTGTVNGTNINIDITLNNTQHVQGTVDISALATTQWVNTQLANYATNEDLGDVQEQITGLALTSSGNSMSINGTSANIVNSISGTVSDGKLKISVNGVESGDIPLPESDSWFVITENAVREYRIDIRIPSGTEVSDISKPYTRYTSISTGHNTKNFTPNATENEGSAIVLSNEESGTLTKSLNILTQSITAKLSPWCLKDGQLIKVKKYKITNCVFRHASTSGTFGLPYVDESILHTVIIDENASTITLDSPLEMNGFIANRLNIVYVWFTENSVMSIVD